MAYLHILFAFIMVGPWALIGFLRLTRRSKDIETSVPSTRMNWSLVLNSAVLYALAYNGVFFVQELFLALGKRWLGLKAYLYHNNHGWDGSHPMTDLAQGYGALAIFILGIIALLSLILKWNSSGWFRLFVIWVAFQGLYQSLAQIPTGVVAPRTDVGRAMSYLEIPLGLALVGSTLAIFAMAATAYFTGKKLLMLASDPNHLESKRSKIRYLTSIAILPAMVGVILIVPFRITPWERALDPIMLTFIGTSWILAFGFLYRHANSFGNEANYGLLKLPIVLLFLLLLFFQLVLAPGVSF